MNVAATIRGSEDPTSEEMQERRVRLAKGESPAAIARHFGRSPSTLYNQAQREKEQIALLRETVLEGAAALAAVNWINNVARSTEVFESDADRLHELSYDPSLSPRDVERYLKTATHIATRAHELNAMLPQRVQAQVEQVGTLTYEMPGIDLASVARGWERGAMGEGVSAPVTISDTTPGPVSAPGPVPAEHSGSEAVSRDIERGALAIVDALKHRAVMHREQILRLMPGDNTEAKLAKALEAGWLTIDDQDQVRLGPVPVPAPAPVPERHAGKNAAA
jgi:hypothetical protein